MIVAQTRADYDRLERAAELIRQQQIANAEAEIEAVLRVTPRDPNALNLLGVIRAQQKHGPEAEQLALKQSPALIAAYLNLGKIYSEQQNAERALWAFLEASKLSPDRADVNFNLASLYVDRHEYQRALEYLEKIPSSQWGVEGLYLGLQSYLNSGRTGEALALTSAIKEAREVTEEQTAGFAVVLLKHHLPDQAIDLLEPSSRQHPHSYLLLYQLGASYAQKEQWNRAEEFYNAALAAKPDDANALLALGRAARVQGDFEKALAHLVRARRVAPESPQVLYDFGLTALQMDLVLDALPVFQRLQQIRPDEPAYLYMLAVATYRHDEKDRTEALMRRYIRLRPRDALGYYLLGATLFSVKRPDEAETMLLQSVALSPNADAEYLLGRIADDKGDTAAALGWLERAVKSEPRRSAAHTALGTIYYKTNSYSLAQRELSLAIQLNANDLRAHYQLGLVYIKIGDKEQAQKMFARADELRNQQRKQETIGFKLIDGPQ